MAARENQGYLIAVILLVLVSIVLAVLTYFGFSSGAEAASQAASYKQQLEDEEKASAGYEAQATALKAMIGVAGASSTQLNTAMDQIAMSGQTAILSETEQIRETYEADMSKYTRQPEGIDTSYRGLTENISNAINDMHNNAALLNNKVEEAVEKLRTELAAKDQEIEEMNKQLNATREDLAREKTAHATTRTELNDKLNTAEANVKRLSTDLSNKVATIEQKDKEYTEELSKKEERIVDLQIENERLSRLEIDVADGQIVGVAPSQSTVTINIGSSDKLRLNQTFAVYDHSKTQFNSGEEKAKIEVIRIIGDHLAQARIIDSATADPILVRDFVSSVTWDPGYANPVAIVGVVDLDGDGKSDLERLISIIEQNGGKVVAYHDEEGNVSGAISENTRVIVKGDKPFGKGGDGYETLMAQNKKYLVREQSIREFLNGMGYRVEAKIQRFNEPEFEPRKPGVVEGGGAFDSNN